MFNLFIRSKKQFYYFLIELTLITVGVLAALAVENFRQSLRETEIERNYLLALRSSVQADTAMLKVEIQKCFNKQKASKTFLELIRTRKAIGEAEFEAATQAVMMGIDPFYSTAIFEDLRSSGNLQIISNIQLRNSVINYYNTLEQLKEIYGRMRTENSYNPAFTDNLSFEEYSLQNLDQEGIVSRLKESKEASIYLARLEKLTYTFYSSLLFRTLPASLDLLDEINAELDR